MARKYNCELQECGSVIKYGHISHDNRKYMEQNEVIMLEVVDGFSNELVSTIRGLLNYCRRADFNFMKVVLFNADKDIEVNFSVKDGTSTIEDKLHHNINLMEG